MSPNLHESIREEVSVSRFQTLLNGLRLYKCLPEAISLASDSSPSNTWIESWICRIQWKVPEMKYLSPDLDPAKDGYMDIKRRLMVIWRASLHPLGEERNVQYCRELVLCRPVASYLLRSSLSLLWPSVLLYLVAAGRTDRSRTLSGLPYVQVRHSDSASQSLLSFS